MKIVTYNVNGLRSRVSQFGSLLKLLDSLDADIICFQETKLSRQELRADLARAKGYESFFSCTRTSDKGRTGYSGVATFCRVKSAFSSEEVALPLSAEEGFTGLPENFSGDVSRRDDSVVEGLEDFSVDELLKVDREGRCIITDHGHFVLFNVYGPRAECDDTKRIQFKFNFFKILQRRWDCLLRRGRRVFVVGDLNIAPGAIDRCDAGPEFEKNEFRKWFRYLLMGNGGQFFDVFREKHPERREAYTCWPTNSGAEEFNYGTRIDHILIAGPCFHRENQGDHGFVLCHVKECDILLQFKRWKPGNTPRWKGGRNVKLEGSDHVPVYMSLVEIPNIQPHNTPPLSTRYCPQVYGCQQTLVSMLVKRKSAEEFRRCGGSSSFSEESTVLQSCNQLVKRPPHSCSSSSLNLTHEGVFSTSAEAPECYDKDSSCNSPCTDINSAKLLARVENKKKARQSNWSQQSLKSFFQSSNSDNSSSLFADNMLNRANISNPCCESNETIGEGGEFDAQKEWDLQQSVPMQEENGIDGSEPLESEKNNVAIVEWQRIQQLMQNSIPLCKGHKEPCVSRVVKKAGPNLGRHFYVCARAEGPASNPEANCGYFKWTASKLTRKR